ncbi:MAG: hypothetical protein JW795_23445, partial [Chitinivibrionales bacterium]|nr:hypothetical protein [Chitinivibrionales bacterium]
IMTMILLTISDRGNASEKIVLVDKNCFDGRYILEPKEKFYKESEMPAINDLVSSFSASNYMAFIDGVLQRRYPTGRKIIELAGGKSAVDQWLWSKSSASQILSQLSLVVHEIGHGIDKQSPENWYFIALDKEGKDFALTAPGMHAKGSVTTSPMYSMARSLLLSDTFNKLRPPAADAKIKMSKEFGNGPFGCDKDYAKTYLTGDPSDDSFDSGDQGFNSLIDEFLQYSNSLALSYYFQTYIRADRASSDRHAMLNWMWWLERYLHKIRNEQAEQYNYLLKTKPWPELILSLWGKGWLYLNTNLEGMQPDSKYLQELVQRKESLAEIQYIREVCDCKNPEELLPNQTAVTPPAPEGGQKQTALSSYCYQTSQGVEIIVRTPSAAPLSVTISTVRGTVVRTIRAAGSNSGPIRMLWDGKDADGRFAATSIYCYSITAGGHSVFHTMFWRKHS